MRHFWSGILLALPLALPNIAQPMPVSGGPFAPGGESLQLLSLITPVQGDDAATEKGMYEILMLTKFFCENIYPKPTLLECLDKVKHGIGSSADPHSEFFNEKELAAFREQSSGTFVGVGIEISRPNGIAAPVVVVSPIEGGPAERAGILSGDYITYILKDQTTRVPTTALTTDQVVKMLRGDPGTSVTVAVARKGVQKELSFTLVREMIKVASVDGDVITSGGKKYAYIKVKQFREGVASATEKKYSDLKRDAAGKLDGLILSLENDPGGLFDEAYNMIRLFDASHDDIVLTRSNKGIEPYVPTARRLLHPNPRDITKGLPILVVVNGGSASASEVVAKALRHKYRATVAGTSETFGKGIVQTVAPGPNYEFAVKFTSSEYLIGSMTDWVPVQCIGVGLDIKFAYPGIKQRTPLTECELSGHVSSAGPMLNAPVHRPIKEVNPLLFNSAQVMLDAYVTYMVPKLQQQEALRTQLEEESNK